MLLKTHMHATEHPYISAKWFRKRLLQYWLVDGCWKAMEENTAVRTVNALYTVGKTDLEHAQTFITLKVVVVSATFK